MNSSGRTIFKNASVMMVSQVITWALALLLTVFLPRFLGPEAIGQFHLAASIWAMLALLITTGMDLLLTKEIARSPEKTGVLLGTAVGLRSLFFVLSLVFLGIFVRVAGYPPVTILVLYVSGISYFIGLLAGVFHAILQGLEQMEYISLASIVNKVINTVLAISLLLTGFGVVAIATVGIVGGLVNLLIVALALRKVELPPASFSWDTAKWLLPAAGPYLASSIFLVFYTQMDVVILSLILNEKTVGWYSAADHLFSTLLFFPVILMQAVFPALVREYGNVSDNRRPLVSQSFHWLLLLGVPMGIGLVVIADPLVAILYGAEFAPSGAVLAVDGVVLILMYLTVLLGRTLVAMDRQKEWTIVMAIATVATIPLDLLLIPWCQRAFGNGAIGGALAYVVTETWMVLAGLYLLPRGTFKRSDVAFALRVLLAGTLMGLFAWWWRDYFIAIPVLAGTVAYPLLLLLLRVIPEEEMAQIRWFGASTLRRVGLRTSGSHVGGS